MAVSNARTPGSGRVTATLAAPDVTTSGTAERIRQSAPAVDVTSARVSRPSRQRSPIANPPRARSPVTSPAGHAAGSAGSSSIAPSSDCSSISATAAVRPNAPSTCSRFEQIENRLPVV